MGDLEPIHFPHSTGYLVFSGETKLNYGLDQAAVAFGARCDRLIELLGRDQAISDKERSHVRGCVFFNS